MLRVRIGLRSNDFRTVNHFFSKSAWDCFVNQIEGVSIGSRASPDAATGSGYLLTSQRQRFALADSSWPPPSLVPSLQRKDTGPIRSARHSDSAALRASILEFDAREFKIPARIQAVIAREHPSDGWPHGKSRAQHATEPFRPTDGDNLTLASSIDAWP